MSQLLDLLHGSLDGVSLTIVGALPALPPHVGAPAAARARWCFDTPLKLASKVERVKPLRVLLRTHQSSPGALASSLVDVGDAGVAPPILFEAMTYDAYLESAASDLPVELVSDSPGVVVPVRTLAGAGGARTSHYRIELGNEVGILALRVARSGKVEGSKPAIELGRLEVEVFPRKLDYQTDYRAMLVEIARIAPALIFEAAGRTALPAGLSDVARQTSLEWYEILRATASDLLATIDLASRDPQRRLHPAARWVRTERARRVRPHEYDSALRLANNVETRQGGALWPRKVLDHAAVPDFDVAANRYVRWLLESIVVRLAQLEVELSSARSAFATTSGGRAVAKRWANEVAAIRPEFQRRLRREWLAEVSAYEGGVPSPGLESHPLYSRAFSLGRALLRGLHIESFRIADVATRPVSTLYEYWCFFAIVNTLRRHAALIQTSAIRIDFQGSRLALRRGQQAAVTFQHRQTGRFLRVFYNREYETPTVTQRPDASVHIESDTDVHVFDAKYRLQFDTGYVECYGGVGPRVDDVSTMHRYRDAIVERDGDHYQRLVKSACVLFPWSDSTGYATHAFARSLKAVGVGGLPFLPSCTDLVTARLDAIVGAALARNRTAAPDANLRTGNENA